MMKESYSALLPCGVVLNILTVVESVNEMLTCAHQTDAGVKRFPTVLFVAHFFKRLHLLKK